MTKEEFIKLSLEAQESFLNSGNTFSSVAEELVEVTHPTDTTEENLVESKIEEVVSPPIESRTPPPDIISGAPQGTCKDEHKKDEQKKIEVIEPSPYPEQNKENYKQVIREMVHSEPYISDEVNLSEEDKRIIFENKTQRPDGFDFESPLELLFILDEDIRSGRVKLHYWQIEFLLDFAKGGETDEHPYQALVRACNGSGKDKYCIAPCAVWLAMRYRLSRSVVTSSSGFQLDKQTCFYIIQLCSAANRLFGNVWKINYRSYVCLATESDIACFATDEPGKAEGFHPAGFGRKMGLFESEAKTVPDDIYIAQNKCTGYTHRALVSTPGIQNGHFFHLCNSSPFRKDLKSVNDSNPIDYIQYHVTAYDCPHLSRNYIEQMKRDLPGGENGAAFKSQVMAEFGSTDEQVVIPYSHLWRLKSKTTEWIQEPFNTAGLDLADGGAETVLATRNGNKLLHIDAFQFDDANDTVEHLEDLFKKRGLTASQALIFGDSVGAGKPILDILKRRGWSNIRYFDSRHASTEKSVYYRFGDEVWFKFGILVQNGEIILVDDDQLNKQLATRYYKILEGKWKLLSKPEQRAKGYPSPDRADAVVYAYHRYKSTFIPAFFGTNEVPIPKPVEVKPISQFVMKSAANGRKANLKAELSAFFEKNRRQKDFSLLKEEIANYNKAILTNNN